METKNLQEFNVKALNSMIETIDGVIQKIGTFNNDNLELNNAVKHLLDACTRITAFYTSRSRSGILEKDDKETDLKEFHSKEKLKT